MTKRQLEKRIRRAFENATPERAISTPAEPLLSNRQDREGTNKKVRTPIQFRAIGALAATVALVMLVAGVLVIPRDNTGPAASGSQPSTSQPSTSQPQMTLPGGFASSTIPSADLLSAIYEHCDVPFVTTQIGFVKREIRLWGDKAYYEVELEYCDQEYTFLVAEDCTMAYTLPQDVLFTDILTALNYPDDLGYSSTIEQEWILTDDGMFLAVAIATEDAGNCYLLTPELKVAFTYPLVSLRPILEEIFGANRLEFLVECNMLEVDFDLTSGGFYFEIESDSQEWLYNALSGQPVMVSPSIDIIRNKIIEYVLEKSITLPGTGFTTDIQANVYVPDKGLMTVVTYEYPDASYIFHLDNKADVEYHMVVYKTYVDYPIDTTGPAPTVGNTEGPPVNGETTPMDKYKALDIAMELSGITKQDIVDFSIISDKSDEPDDIDHYDVWILTFDCLYEYEISMIDGGVLDYEKESLETATPPDGQITADQALQIALDYLGIQHVENPEFEVDRETNHPYYDISFIYDGYEYEFEIGLFKDEGILDWEKTELESPPSPPDGKFTEDQALQVVLDYLGIKAETIEELEITINQDEEVPYYDITFLFMDHEFEFEISLYGGRILRLDAPEVDG